MFRTRWLLCALVIGLVLAPAAARARTLGVDVWTDRGKDAVYEPGETVQIKVRTTDDAYLLVYDIDAEGYVHVLFPYEGGRGLVEGRHTYRVPPSEAGIDLVVEEPIGQGFIVAIASREPFNPLPRYLRPYDPQAEQAGYVGEDEEAGDQQDVDEYGRIMGDPFVAMERIRRAVLDDPSDREGFASEYSSYYVHQPVRYPRYLCNDCHRPQYWAWWDGWDPYYTTCPSFDFRVYWGWSWGPRYWFGTVPYFCFVPRCYPCDPYDRPYYTSWGGQRQWDGLWSGHLVRHKTAPPAGYTPPSRKDTDAWRQGRPLPPGMIAAETVRRPDGQQVRVPIGANRPYVGERGAGRPGGSTPVIRSDGGVRREPLGRPSVGEGSRVPSRGGTVGPAPGRREGGSPEVRRPSEGRSAPSEVRRPSEGRSTPSEGHSAPSTPRVEPRHDGGSKPSSPPPAERGDSKPDRGSSRPAPAAPERPHDDRRGGR